MTERVACRFAAAAFFVWLGSSCTQWSAAPDIHVNDCMARVLPNGVGVVYLEAVNRGVGADRLVSAAAPWAQIAMLHETVIEGDIARMRAADKGFAIGPLSTLSLRAGGRHVTLRGVAIDKRVSWAPLCLHFAKAGDVCVEARVRSTNL